MELFETLSRLTSAHGVSGHENKVRDLIRELAEPYCDECTVDTMGNLICRRRGSGPKVMFAAHMDTIGLIAAHFEKEGFVRFGSVGALPAAGAYQQPVRFENGTMATISVTQDKAGKEFKASDLYLDLGAADREAAQRLISLGDTACYASCAFSAGKCVVSPYLDNRVGCLAVLMAMEMIEKSGNDLYFVFTTQEEVGLRGAKTAAYAVDPDYGIAVDVTLSDDVPEAAHTGSSVLGRGAAIAVMNSSMIAHAGMVQMLDRLAAQHGIPVQHDIIQRGGTDAGPIHTTRVGVITGGISIPTRYIHTPTEMAHWDDIKACAALIKAFAESELAAV